MGISVYTFLNSAEFIDSTVIIYDIDDTIVYQSDGYSENDPSGEPLPEDVADAVIDFWLVEENSGRSTIKIYL